MVSQSVLANSGFNLIHPADLSAMLEKKAAPISIFDANTPDFRAKNGVIPGALLLASSKSYDPAKTLPADKNSQLVFYCANEQCMASHAAAERAVKAGYAHVAVLADGMLGWNAWKTSGKTNSKTN